ncbi:MAG: hypothetical protein OEZ34_07330, partial [Spirochaetia bacterium]|nr:hypothetical protein [Spirochaetia bacterium]
MIEKKIYYGITLILIFSGFSLLAEEKTLDFSKNWHHTRTSALQEMDLERLKARLETSPTIDFPHVDFSTEDYRFHYFMK